MIRVIENKKIFVLQGKTFQYVTFVNRAGFLQFLYFGKQIGDDYDFLIAQAERITPNPDDINMDMVFDDMPSECGFFGRGDYREPTVVIERDDGAKMSRFRYVSYSLTNGVPKLCGLPQVRRSDQTLCITLRDDFSASELDLYYIVANESDAFIRYIAIRNVGDKPIKIKKAYSFCLDMPQAEYETLSLVGKYGYERTPQRNFVGRGVYKVGSTRGKSSHGVNPFLGILQDACTEDTGVCYGFNLLYSGSFSITAEYSQSESLRVQGGISEQFFSWELAPNESFETPQTIIAFSQNGIGEMSRVFADFYRNYIIDPAKVKATRPIVINNWEATYFDFTSEKLFEIINEAAKCDIDTFVLDDGWFGHRNDDTTSLGDWFVNENKLKGGLQAIIDCCKQNGMKFGLWFEPEMISEESELFRLHPEFAIMKSGVEPCRGRNQLVLDFTSPQVVDYVFERINDILSKYEISYVKWDMNRDLTECYSETLSPNRQGEFFHRYMLGVYALAEKLTSAHPNIFFEGCAGGGGRFDGGMLYYFPQIWTSDNTDGYERTKIQWGTSICYPVSAMSCHVSVCPSHQTFRTTPFVTRGAIASLGPTGYELDICKCREEEKELVKKQITEYKEVSGLVLDGDLYRLKNPYTDNAFCVALISKDKTCAYIVYECLRTNFAQGFNTLKIHGLDDDKLYEIEETGQRCSGSALGHYGVKIPNLTDYETWILHIREIVK